MPLSLSHHAYGTSSFSGVLKRRHSPLGMAVIFFFFLALFSGCHGRRWLRACYGSQAMVSHCQEGGVLVESVIPYYSELCISIILTTSMYILQVKVTG